MFVVSKLAWFFATPSNLLIALSLLGAIFACASRQPLARRGRRLGLTSLALVAICGLSPLGTWLIHPLEQRFPAYVEEDQPIAGVIVLGGAILPNLSFDRKQLIMGEAAERVVAFADLARRHPNARLIFSGGSGALIGDDAVEAAALARFGATLGIEPARVTLERVSRTTWENARMTKPLLAPQTAGRWLLVTSAWHMPRAIGAFRAAGVSVTPYPVDYRTSPQRLWRFEPSVASGLDRVDLAVREWAGLLAYRLTGRSSALLPGP